MTFDDEMTPENSAHFNVEQVNDGGSLPDSCQQRPFLHEVTE